MAFINQLRTTLAAHPRPDNVAGHPVLPRQHLDQPPASWIHVPVTAGDKTVTLALRDDNLYLIGFKAQSGSWYELGYAKPGEQPQIHGATLLQCDDTYRALLGGGSSKQVKQNMKNLQLGKTAAEAAVKHLTMYAHAAAAGPDEATKVALARMLITVCEAARMSSISTTLSTGWGQAATVNLDDIQPFYIHNWGNLSTAILERRKQGPRYPWPKKLDAETHIKDAAGALAVVQLLLNRAY
ncbi:ribosome-inactivating protein 3-like [Hordeum vulgare subsp. vulgare]|uniref:rRNA N-glycosylase n=1 Tax=Hordeum vulgare subsp. vulgare TaxID=112509 RepID=A0A8I6YT33_HORVV|nr:ribosome-inactivating protein 3-like [Hordeum vulgare subsp. vulgare]